jgi:hypothetical protein
MTSSNSPLDNEIPYEPDDFPEPLFDPGELRTRLGQVVAQIRALRAELATALREEDVIRELLELPPADPGAVPYLER